MSTTDLRDNDEEEVRASEESIFQQVLDQKEVEVLEAITNEELKKDVTRMIVQAKYSRTTIYNSPIPLPSDLRAYYEISPELNLVDRLFVMAEATIAHERNKDLAHLAMEQTKLNNEKELVKYQLDADIIHSKRGQIFAFVFVMVAVGLGFTAIMFGHELGGAIISALGVATIATAFITGKRHSS